MEHMDYIELKRRELVATAEGMIIGTVNLLEGVRRICKLRFEIDDPDNTVFLPIRAIESDTEKFPIGSIRSNFSHGYLQQLDEEVRDYLESARNDILRSCRSIRDAFSTDTLGEPGKEV